ncbi:hypothetical protein G6F22_019613 [Rhizopus arrhizus]|nr:hypothetical protein G6F22_019613 [Rhizopus arrhizus]
MASGDGAFFQRADHGQHGGAAAAVAGDLLILRAQVQAGVRRRAPREAGGDELAFVIDVLVLGVAVPQRAGQAIEEFAFFVGRAREVE